MAARPKIDLTAEVRSVYKVTDRDPDTGEWTWHLLPSGHPQWAVDVVIDGAPDDPMTPGPHESDDVVRVKLSDSARPDLAKGGYATFIDARVGAWAANGRGGLYYQAKTAVPAVVPEVD